MLKSGFIISSVTLTAGMAQASTLTLDFNSNSTGCATGTTIAGVVSVTEGHCQTVSIGQYQYMQVGDRFVVTAEPGYTFDYQGANILYYWDETFALPVADVPAGIDMTNPADIEFVNQNWLWQPAVNTLPLISVSGYTSGSLVQTWSDIFPDTDTYNASIGYTPPPGAIDWDKRGVPGAPMTSLDRLEISFASQLAPASLDAPLLIGDIWYTRLPDGGYFVFDDLALGITVTPAPVPLPAGSALLLGGLLALGTVKRRGHNRSG